jgi:hypothetical protein
LNLMENYPPSQFESREMGERVPKCEIPRKNRGIGSHCENQLYAKAKMRQA